MPSGLRQQQRAGAGDEQRHAAQPWHPSLVHAAAAAAVDRSELRSPPLAPPV